MKNAGKAVPPLAALVLAAFGSYAVTIGRSDAQEVHLGNHVFEIPEQYSRETVASRWLDRVPGLDDGSRDYLLQFSAEELATSVPGYRTSNGGFVEDMRAILSVLSPLEVARYKDTENYRDLWEGNGSYENRVVEPYLDGPWYKVYRRNDYPVAWLVVTRSPQDSDAELPNNALHFVVAQCRTSSSPLTESGEVTRCDSHLLIWEDVAIEFYISGENLQLIDEVRDHLRSKILGWMVE